MGDGEKMRRYKKILLILICILVIAGCSRGNAIGNRLDWEVPDFTFINQNEEETSFKDLKGKIWIADFIFTSCSTVCSPMTANMAQLQSMVEEESLQVEFISFSVDPEVDTPMRLKQYGENFSADLSNWSFLTGYSQAEIEELAYTYFKQGVKKEEGNEQVAHGTYFYLIDQKGKIVRYYKGDKEVPFEEIINHIKQL